MASLGASATLCAIPSYGRARCSRVRPRALHTPLHPAIHTSFLTSHCTPTSPHLALSPPPFPLPASPRPACCSVPRWRVRASADAHPHAPAAEKPPRHVVEYVCLYRMASDLSEEAEADMLSHLYTLQYHYPHVLALSLGPLYSKRPIAYTHGLVARFPSRHALDEFLTHPSRTAALRDHVLPLCQDSLELAYEAAVEQDIETIFRRGESFERGIEHLVLLRVKAAATAEQRQQMLSALHQLPSRVVPAVVVQLTAGTNFTASTSKGFTHALVARFPTEEDLEAYNKHASHREVLRRHVLPISEAVLAVDFRVEPVGENVM